MSENSLQEEKRVWMMRRNCSFSPKQLGLFYLAQSLFALIVASFFWWQGVWLVMPFTLVELSVLAIALLIYARHTTDYESIKLENGFIEVQSQIANVHQLISWNALWVSIYPELNERQLITLRYQGKVQELGRFLTVVQRYQFLKEIQLALKSIKL
jgi:uncharacterized membrane protein